MARAGAPPLRQSPQPKRIGGWPMAALLAFGALYSMLFLGLPSRWWFEDDPTLFAYASTIRNPALIFTNAAVLKHLTGGLAFTPMQVLSYWVDVRIAGFSTGFAYAHQMCSFLLTLLLLYLLLALLLRGDRLAALSGSVFWCLLPSTAVVVQFLATRHYLEGMLFGILGLYLAERLRDGDGRLPWWGAPAALFAAFLSMLYKEIYAPVVPALLLVFAWRRRDRILAASAGALACVYAVCRWLVIGPALTYGDMPLLTSRQYEKFILKLPYTLSSNYGGYCLAAAIAAIFAYGALRRGGLKAALVFGGLLVVSLATVWPVSYPLYGTIRSPGTWYRVVFLMHTISLGFAAWAVTRWWPRWLQTGLAAVALIVLVPGAVKTRALWMQMTSSAEREGRFYLAHPDRVVLSEQAADSFLPGLDWMYGIGNPHYVLTKDLARTTLAPGVPVWRFTRGAFVPDYEYSGRPPVHQ